jgi:hypothetical protein
MSLDLPLKSAPRQFPSAFEPGSAPPGARIVGLEQLGHKDCRWPLYDDPEEPMLFCGAPAKGRYCPHHRTLSLDHEQPKSLPGRA